MSLLTTSDLSIGYGKSVLSAENSLELEKGKLVGLIGQNGVGKSTLLRTMSGFQKPLAGNIHLMGRNIEDLPPKDRAKSLAVVLTEKPMAMNLTSLELIGLGRHPHSGWLGRLSEDDKRAIDASIEQCSIAYLMNKRLYQLSDGQLQKVLIARALAQDTDLIFLDEPTSHLDPGNKFEVLELLKAVCASGKSAIISTHEIRISAKTCDQFWCMDFNRPVHVGKPKELLDSGYVEEVLRLAPGIL